MMRVFIANLRNLIFSLPRLVWRLIGFHLRDVDDMIAIRDLKKFESICISFNILPNGFAQDPSITPSRWTETKSILYLSFKTIHIIHLTLLSFIEIPGEWHLVLGDFLYVHPNRKYFWLLWLNGSILSEILRHYWIFLMKNGKLTTFRLYHLIYLNGYNSELLCMSQFYCQKFRFVVANLANMWIWIVYFEIISFAPILIFIVYSGPQSPRTSIQFIYTSFWLFITYLGMIFTMINLVLTGALCTIHLSNFYFKAGYVAQTVKGLASKRGKLNNVDYLRDYKATVNKIIKYQNEIERLNISLRNWLIFVYIGLSCTTDFGVYIAVFIHIDRFMDIFIFIVASIAVVCIGACSYINGVILTEMSSNCKNLRKATRCLKLNVRDCIKGLYVQSRLSRTDAAFTIGELLDITSQVFVIYLIENTCLIMMFKVNFK